MLNVISEIVTSSGFLQDKLDLAHDENFSGDS